MHLKRLTIQGFKSFARRTVFEFEPGVTAVVGPNGSGKSNVSDALRWVLGEQSTRLLRTRRQEDPIFSGSGGRAPAGVAEVTLTLDNEDGWLPLDFAEVEIGRRVYRDGSSEYLLNGARARLRDVQDVLARADLGQNSYAIMGQGLVDQVLALAPLERRRIIDEAAGIQPLRSRITDARARLDETHANMDQVSLIVSEIEPRLERLRRQAGRAEEHARFTGELQRLLAASFAHRLREARSGVEAGEAALEQRQDEHAQRQAELTGLGEQLDGLAGEIGRRRRVLIEAATQRRAHQQQIMALDRERVLAEERLAVAHRRSEALRQSLAALEQQAADLAIPPPPSSETPAADVNALRDEAAAVEAQLAGREREIAAMQAARRTQDERAAAARRARERREQAAQRLDAVTAELEESGTRRAGLLLALKEYGADYLEIKDRLSQAELRLSGDRRDADDSRQRLRRLEAEVRSVDTEHAGAVRRSMELCARLDALRTVANTHEGVTTGTRAVLQFGGALEDEAPPADALPGIHGMLASLIRVPASLEAAVSAALEHRLHAVVVDRADDAYAAIERLQGEAAGRAQFLPLDAVSHVPPVNLHADDGIIGVAARLVRCLDRQYQPLVDTLLGRVIICADLASARRTLGRGLGSVVTLDGTFIERHGEVSGGDHQAESGLFAQQRELDDLPARIAKVEADAKRLEGQSAHGRAAIEQVRERAEAAESAYEQARRDADRLRAQIARENQRLFGIRKELSTLQARRERLEAEAARAREEAAAPVEQPAARPAEEAARLATATRERDQLVARTGELRLAIVQAESARRAAEEAVRQREAARAQAEESLRRAREELAGLERGEASLAAHLDQTAAALAALEGDPLAQSDAAEAEQRELGALELQELEEHVRLREAERRVLEAEQHRLEAASVLARRQDTAASLAAEIEREGYSLTGEGVIEPVDAPPGSFRPEERLDQRALASRIDELRRRIRGLGPVNTEAPEDLSALQERHELLTTQLADLEATEVRVVDTIDELDGEIGTRFVQTFEAADAAFRRYFSEFFGGGDARMVLLDPDNPADSGIEIEASPPGKRISALAMLSGGERALTAVALLFALLSANPAPFCVLDEVDAALDEANVGRFTGALQSLAGQTQFLVVTHNRRTIEVANALYGVTMGKDGISTVLSLRLAEVASA